MISIDVKTKGDLRLREYAKYIAAESNFGFTAPEINKAVSIASKKAFGKYPTKGVDKSQNTTIPGEALLRSINSIKANDTPLNLNQLSDNLLLSAILKDPALSARYKKATSSFNITSSSKLGYTNYFVPVQYTNSFLSIKLQDKLVTKVNPLKTRSFLSHLSNSTLLSSMSLDLKDKTKKTKKVVIKLDEDVSSITVSDPLQKEKFLSGAQLSILVRKKLRQTSVTHPAKNKPDLSFRTGQNFINTVEVHPNYRQNLITFMYNPLMDENIKYGNNPALQVERSIRDVLREYYKREMTEDKKFTVYKG